MRAKMPFHLHHLVLVPAALTFCADASPVSSGASPMLGEAGFPSPGGGLVRVDLSPDWIAACPDGTTYRLVQESGAEIPFAVRTSDDTSQPRTFDLKWTPSDAGIGWRYEIEAPRRPVTLRALRIRDLPEGVVAHLHLVTPGGATDSLVWRLSGTGAGVHLDVDLPPALAVGPWTATLDVVDGSPLFRRSPLIDFSALLADPAAVDPVDLVVATGAPVPDEDDASRLAIGLPRPGLPLRGLHLDVADETFSRSVTVAGVEPGGAETTFQTSSVERLKRGGVTFGSTDLVLASDAPADVVLRLYDGLSEPLVIRGATVRLRGVSLLVPDAPAGRVRVFGCGKGGRTYDIQRLSGDLAAEPFARAALSPPGRNPEWSLENVLGDLALPGPELAGRSFGAERDVLAAEQAPLGGLEGTHLVRVPLDPEILSATRDDVGDLRVLDARGRQLPYLLGPSGALRTLDGVTENREERGTQSVVHVSLGRGGMPVQSVLIRSPRGDFSREVSLRAASGHGLTWWQQTWTGASEGSSRLVVPLRRKMPERFSVVIENGDNPPLPLDSVEVTWKRWDLWTVIPAEGGVRVRYGSEDLTAPSYDIARLREYVLAQPAEAATLGQERTLDRAAGPTHKTLVAGAIALLAVTMLVLVTRVVRARDSGSSV
jgi:hypothetical protein